MIFIVVFLFVIYFSNFTISLELDKNTFDTKSEDSEENN